MKHPGYSLYQKEIVYCPQSRDFALYLEGELVGFARTYADGEATLDSLISEIARMRHGTPESVPVHQPAN